MPELIKNIQSGCVSVARDIAGIFDIAGISSSALIQDIHPLRPRESIRRAFVVAGHHVRKAVGDYANNRD